MKKLMIVAVAVVATGLLAMAGTPTSFAYQGVLRDETGKPLAQEQATITFRLYNSNEDKASVLWQKELNLAIDTNGLFNAELTGGDLAEVFADAEKNSLPLYIGLTVRGSSGEISPRQKIVAAPLAAYAQNVARADKDFTVKGSATFEGAVGMNGANNTFKATNVETSGGLDVMGDASLKGGTEMSGAVKVTGEISVPDGARLMVEGAEMSLPIGVIMMWAGSEDTIPSSCWALCDGKTEYELNGTKRKVPDLSGLFVVGVGSCTDTEGNAVTYNPGDTGGLYKHKLTTNEMPSHTHTIDKGKNQVEFYLWSTDGGWVFGDSGSQHKDANYDTLKTGGDQAHENRPPYYALCYIIKVK